MTERTAPFPESETAERARKVFDVEPRVYGGVELHESERRLLDEVGTRWGETAMLDLGVGSGRTTLTFGAICRDYVGIDYSAEMVRRARERAAALTRAEIREGDARAMPEFADARFDVALFSFNGLDAIDHDGRLRALREIHRVVRPGGRFLFSSHTLAPRKLHVPPIRLERPFSSARVALGAIRQHYQFKIVNAAVDYAEARRRGYAIYLEGHNFRLPQYYVTPTECARQIAAAGFELTAVSDRDGRDLPPEGETDEPWVFYWCRRAT